MTVTRIEGATEKTETLRPTDAIDRISLDTMNGELGPCFTRKGLREALADGGRIVTDQAVYIEGGDVHPDDVDALVRRRNHLHTPPKGGPMTIEEYRQRIDHEQVWRAMPAACRERVIQQTREALRDDPEQMKALEAYISTLPTK